MVRKITTSFFSFFALRLAGFGFFGTRRKIEGHKGVNWELGLDFLALGVGNETVNWDWDG